MERHGLSAPTASFVQMTTGALSPMAFLVGVTKKRTPSHPHPARHDHLAPLWHMWVCRR